MFGVGEIIFLAGLAAVGAWFVGFASAFVLWDKVIYPEQKKIILKNERFDNGASHSLVYKEEE